MRLVLTLVCLCSVASTVHAQDWPRWRGPQANGVAEGVSAPERWSETEGVVWRTEIEGSGISSPVIAGRRVYVTTAISWEQRSALRAFCDYFTGWLALFGVPTIAYLRWKRASTQFPTGHTSFVFRASQRLDALLCVFLATTVLVFGTTMAVGPQALDLGLHAFRDIGVTVARSLGRLHTNLSFLTWTDAAPHNRWIISNAMALVSLGLIPFLSQSNSKVRVAGTVTLFVGAALSVAYVPWPQAYGAGVPRGILVVLYSPVVVLALWHLFQYVVGRWHSGTGESASTLWSMPSNSIVPAVLSLGMFVSPNYLPPDETLVTRRLVCLDAVSGNKIWETDAFATRPETRSPLNSYATPTPNVAEGTIVAAFGPGLAAFDLDGRRLWSKMFAGWIEGSVYGAASSPVIDGEAVFVTIDREYDARRESQVIAYSLKTGNEIWRQSPQFAHDGYATPVTHHDGNRKLLLTLTSKALAGYVAASGDVAWQLEIPVQIPIPSLVADGNRLYVTGAVGGGGYTAAYLLRANKVPEKLWTSSRSPADVSSPVLYKQRLFTITSTGIMVCYDAESGEIIWRKRVGSGLGVFYASLVAADDKVYAVKSNGTTYVIAVEDKFRLVSESSLPEEIFASPAFGADCLFLRTTSALYCIRSQTQESDEEVVS